MALDFLTGFDCYATAQLASGVFTAYNSVAVQTSVVRTGYGALHLDNSTAYVKQTGLSNAATRVLGFAYRVSSSLTEDRIFACLSDGDPATAGNVQVGLALRTGGAIAVYRGRGLGQSAGGTQLGSDSSNTLSAATWYHIELKALISDTVGTVEVYVNGSKTNWIDLTSQDTKETANAYANAFGLNCSSNGNNQYIDDLYCISGSGGTRTDRLGDVKVVTIQAVPGNGTRTDFTPLSGSDHGAMVDEQNPDSDTSYNAEATAASVDTYHMQPLSVSGTIYGAQIRNFLKKTDASTCDARNVARIAGTNYYGSVVNLSTSYLYYNTITEVSPATLVNYTAAEIDASEFGAERNA